jgi:hypothetical protein
MEILDIVKKQFPDCKVRMELGTIEIKKGTDDNQGTIYLLPQGSVIHSENMFPEEEKSIWLISKDKTQINFF